MKIVLAEVPYTKDRDISVEKSCVPEGAELTMAVFDEHAENNDAFYAEIKDADIIIDGYVHFGKKEIDAMDHCRRGEQYAHTGTSAGDPPLSGAGLPRGLLPAISERL